jgi:hypothetical protein
LFSLLKLKGKQEWFNILSKHWQNVPRKEELFTNGNLAKNFESNLPVFYSNQTKAKISTKKSNWSQLVADGF